MNRALRNQRLKRCMFRKHGGGYGMGAPLVAVPVNDFSIKVPINQPFDDCAFPARPGQLVSQPDVALAQVAMAGGGYRSNGGAWGKKNTRRASRQYRAYGGDCGCTRMKGGARSNRTRRMRGGVYAVDTSQSVGGIGPNVMPVYATVPCDARAGATTVAGFNPDPRAPVTLYSLTANQSGGAAPVEGVSGATGSLIPVYNAPVAGFTFAPSNAAGSPLPAGVTVYNEVVPQVARVGGASRRRKSRKQRKSRKHRKGSRKH